MRSIPYRPYTPSASPEASARAFHEVMRQRRSVRFFSDAPVSEETLRACVAAAATAPSGANKQPWRFVCVRDPAVKRAIRVAAEAEERDFYAERASDEWLRDLAPLGTDADKPFLEVAPWLVVMFKLVRGDPDADGQQGKVYYPDESVGIAAGMLLAALHHAGLAALTHTPSPMGFLSRVLRRPAHERPYLLIPVGYPAVDCVVPDIARRPVDEVMVVV